MNNLFGTYCFSHRSFSTTKLPLRKSICSRKSYPYLKQVIFFRFLKRIANEIKDKKIDVSAHKKMLDFALKSPPAKFDIDNIDKEKIDGILTIIYLRVRSFSLNNWALKLLKLEILIIYINVLLRYKQYKEKFLQQAVES